MKDKHCICSCKGYFQECLDFQAIIEVSAQGGKDFVIYENLCNPKELKKFLENVKEKGSQKVIVLACGKLQKVLKNENLINGFGIHVFDMHQLINLSNNDLDLAGNLILSNLPGFLEWAAYAEPEEMDELVLHRSVAIIGLSAEADVCGVNLQEMGYEVVRILPAWKEIVNLSDPGKGNLNYQSVVSVEGEAGNFIMNFLLPDKSIKTYSFGAIALADDFEVKKAKLPIETVANVVFSFTEFESLIKEDLEIERIKDRSLDGESVVFVTGLGLSKAPSAFNVNILLSALKLRSLQIPVFFIFRNMHVAEYGSEELFYQSRKAGIKFIRYSQTPDFVLDADHSLFVLCDDDDAETNTDRQWKIDASMVVVEDYIKPSSTTDSWGKLLKIPCGPDGFRMSDNIYYHPAASNRLGIFVFGGSRSRLTTSSRAENGEAAACEIDNFLRPGVRKYYPYRPVYNQEKCSRCLTCYRSCPHGAIVIKDKELYFSSASCKSCGICPSLCPSEALMIPNYDRISVHRLIANGGCYAKHGSIKEYSPSRILVFMCSNSAAKAMASFMPEEGARRLPSAVRFVTLPCAAYLTPSIILDAFQEGYNGVLMLSCYHENCSYLNGNIYAEAQIERIKSILLDAISCKDRLKVKYVAAHMGKQARDAVIDFAEIIGKISDT